jgi:hypothetical protein
VTDPLDPALLSIIEALAEAQARRDHDKWGGTGPAITRLRRALRQSGQEAKDAEIIELLINAFVERLPAGQALLLDRRFTCVAQAAESLPSDATPHQIVELAVELERRPL